MVERKFLCIIKALSRTMNKKGEQTTLRTVRIPRELDNALETVSKERGVSVNSFVSMLLKNMLNGTNMQRDLVILL